MQQDQGIEQVGGGFVELFKRFVRLPGAAGTAVALALMLIIIVRARHGDGLSETFRTMLAGQAGYADAGPPPF